MTAARWSKILPLTTDWTALNAKVDEMTPNGNTNVTIGLAWGWHALTMTAPLTEAVAPAPDIDKVIIILTDGDQYRIVEELEQHDSHQRVRDRRTNRAWHAPTSRRQISRSTRCASSTEMRRCCKSCATNPSMYFDVQNASQLNTVFTSIAQNLANLRIAK